MDKLFQKAIDNRFADFKGLILDASVPVPQSIINEITWIALKGSKSISDCQVFIHEQNQVSVNLKTTLLPWTLNLKLKLDHSVDLASFSSPKIRAWLENNRLLGSLGSFFNMLPEGVKLYGNQIVLDIAPLLETSEQRRMLELIKPLIKSAEIRTEEGKVIFDVSLRVEE
ncbi:MAG TPA: hypothetical protein VK249_25485 [Anaerolineales bacterium]|nr:hypothetical protein [Anaerolineales bacterium]